MALALLSFAASTAAPCSCAGPPSTDLQTCSATGDPHFRSFDKSKFDFMALGTFQYVKAPTKCGCDVEVQVLMAGSAQHAGAALHAVTQLAPISAWPQASQHHAPPVPWPPGWHLPSRHEHSSRVCRPSRSRLFGTSPDTHRGRETPPVPWPPGCTSPAGILGATRQT